MKRIAVLVIGAFMLQQVAPSLLWAGELETAVGNDSSSYEVSGNYGVTENIPEFGAGKPNHTFTVNGSNSAAINGGDNGGFQVKEGETLNLNNVTLNGFAGLGGDFDHVAVSNDGTLVVNNVTSNSTILTPGGEENPKGELVVKGTFENNGGVYQDKVTVQQGGEMTTDIRALNAMTITNDGTLNVGGELENEKRGHFSAPVTGEGVLNITGEVKADSGETITQGQVNVQAGATLENYSTVTAQITNNNKIINGGNGFLYTNGTSVNNGQIVGDGNGAGSIVVASGTLTNTGTINQSRLTIEDEGKLITALNDSVTLNEPLKIDGILEVTGGTNTGTLTDSAGTGAKGTLIASGDFINAAGNTILLKEVEVADGVTFTQEGNFTAGLTNKGTTTNDAAAEIKGGSNTGIIQNTATNKGGFKIVSGTFDNQGTITQGGVEVYEGATLKTAADKINVYNDTSFKNDGTLVLTGGTNTNTIQMSEGTETGVTHIAGGKVTNNGIIKQSAFYIDGATDTTAAGHLVTATDTITDGADLFADYVEIHNDGELTFTGTGASDGNAHTLTGTGTLHINGESGTVINNYGGATITQGNLTVAENNTFGAFGYVTVTDTLTNEGTLNTSGQTEVGTLLNLGSTYVDGGLTVANLDNQSLLSTGNGVTVTNGTNTGTIQTGELRIQGQFDNTGEGMITQNKIDIDHGAQLTTAADKVNATLRNAGTLILTGSEEGLTNNNKIQGGGDLIIRDGKVINADGKTIDQKIIVAAADTTAGTTAGNFTASVKDFLTADMENNAVATLKGFNDSSEEPQNFLDTTVAGTGDLYISGTVVAEREITQGSLNLEGKEEINQFYNLKNGHVTADINTAETARIYNRGTLTVTGGENSGNILDDRETKEGESESKIEISGGKFVNNGMIKQDVINVFEDGEFQTAQNTLILPEEAQISNNGILTITGDGEGGSALRVGKNDQWEGPAETVITGALDNVEKIYQNKLTITKDGSLEMDIGDDYSKFNVANILNNGTFTLTGGTIKENINYDTTKDGASKLVISTGGVKVENEDIVLTQKEIDIVEGGDFSVRVEQLVADKVVNDGVLNLQGGTNTNKIDGTGELGITEDVINNAHIDQRKVVVDGGVTFTHSGNAAEDTPYVLKANVENDGTVQNDAIITAMNDESKEDPLARSSINHEGALFTGKGTLRVGGNFYNEGTLEQNAIVVLAKGDEEGMTQDGHLITAVDTVTAKITNNGLLTLSSGTTGINTNTIDGDSGTLELEGNITNNGSITQHKVDTQGNTLINNGKLSFSEAGANNVITGSGDMEITGNVTQNGNLHQGSLTVADGGRFAADFDNLTLNNALVNDGTLVTKTDSTIRTDISDSSASGAKGRLEITNKTYNEGNIIQKEIVVENNKSFYTAADKVTATSLFDNEGTLILTGGENKNNITGNGKIEIYYNQITNSGSIIQQGLNVSDEATFTTALGEGALQVTNLTNNGVLNLTGGTLTQEIGHRDGAWTAQTNIVGDVTVTGGSFNQKTVTVEQGAMLTADAASLADVTTFTNDGTFKASGELSRAFSGNGELVIAGAAQNTNAVDNAIVQKTLTVENGGMFTTAANTIKADIVNNGILNLTGGTNNNAITNNATLAFQGGTEDAAMLNNKAIAGNGTLNIEGVVENAQGQSIANNIAIASGKSLTAYADDILGNVTANAGTLKLSGGTLQQASYGGETQILGNVALSQATTFGNVIVAAAQTLTAGENNLNVTDMTLNGNLAMSWGGLTKDGTTHTGATLNVSNKLTLGPDHKLLLTFVSSSLQRDEQTDWLTLVTGEGVIDDGLNIVSSAGYQVEKSDDQSKIRVKYVASAEEIAEEAGANKNEAAAAEAWSEELANPDPVVATVASNLDALSRDTSRKEEYVEALESMAPVQVAMTKANVSNLNQGIYTVANNHMSGGAGMAAGEMFSYKSVWMQGLFNNTKYDVDGGFDGNTYGGAVGLDVASGDDTTLGVGYAYAYSDLKATGKKIKADTQNVFLYGNYTGLEDWYFDGTLGYNFGSYKEDKTVTGVTGHGNYKVNSVAAQAMAQYTVNEYFAPLAGLRYVYAHQGKYTDGFGQSISATNDHTLTALLGAKFGRNFQAGKLTLKPLFRVAATYDVMQHGDDVTVTMPSSSYKIQSEQLKKFGAQAGFSLGMDLTDQIELTLGYDGQFRSHYYNHTGSAKLKYSF